jgi:hypothetical protein
LGGCKRLAIVKQGGAINKEGKAGEKKASENSAHTNWKGDRRGWQH